MKIPWRRILAGLLLVVVLDLGLALHLGAACAGHTCLDVQRWAVEARTVETRRVAGGGWVTTMRMQRWGWVRGEWMWGGMP